MAGNKSPGRSLLSDGTSGVAPIMYGKRDREERDYSSAPIEATTVASTCGSGAGYSSTVTTLNEEGDSKFVPSFGQTLKVMNQLNTLKFSQGNKTQFVGISGKYVGRHHRGIKHRASHSYRKRRKYVEFRSGDGEVTSSLSDSVITSSLSDSVITSSTAPAEDLNNVLESTIQDPNSKGVKPEASSLVDSRCSNVDAAKKGDVRHSNDFSYSGHHNEGSGKRVADGSSQDYQSGSVITDLHMPRTSGFGFSFPRTNSPKRFKFEEPVCTSETEDPPATEIMDENLCVSKEHTSRRSEAVPAATHPIRRSPEHKEEICCRPSQSCSSSQELGSARPEDGSSEEQQNSPPPTFVLSSGRLSKEQQKQRGIRPTTIDDDFERYFAQLML